MRFKNREFFNTTKREDEYYSLRIKRLRAGMAR